MDIAEYLRKNKSLITVKDNKPNSLKIIVVDDFETYDSLEDFLTEQKDLEIDWTETPDDTTWVAVFSNPTDDIVDRVSMALTEIGVKGK